MTTDQPGNDAHVAEVLGNLLQARDVSGGINFYPAASTSTPTPRQLPAGVHLFVNRKVELAELDRFARGGAETSGTGAARVVLITGSAGVGKTALALQWAGTATGSFPDGQLYVNLRGFDTGPPRDPSEVLADLLVGLGVPPASVNADLDSRSRMFRSLIVDRDLLVVLDNAVSSDQILPFIPGSSRPLTVVTSRSRLPGLAIRSGVRRVEVDTFSTTDAVHLLNAVAAEGNRRDTPEELSELARLCANLPLALRIAAERAATHPWMELRDLIGELSDESSLWDVLSLDDGATSEAVRTVFAWSYRSLPDDAATMFRRLGVHPGEDISLAAAAVLAGVTTSRARRSLDLLVGAHLVQTTAPRRYAMHDLLKAYALSEAREYDTSETISEALARLLDWAIRSAAGVARMLLPGDFPDVESWIGPLGLEADQVFPTPADATDWYELERLNLRAAARAGREVGLFERPWALAMALSVVHAQHFMFDDWDEFSTIAVTCAERLNSPRHSALANDNRGRYLFRTGQLDQAAQTYQTSLMHHREAGTVLGEHQTLNRMGLVAMQQRRLEECADLFRRSAAGFDELGEVRWYLIAAANHAEALLEIGQPELALNTLDLLLPQFEELDEPAGLGNTLWLLSRARRLTGDPAGARSAITEALEVAERYSNKMWEAFWLIESAWVHLDLGAVAEAMESARAAATLQHQIGDPAREAEALRCVGRVLEASGAGTEAVAFYDRGAALSGDERAPWVEALCLRDATLCLHRHGMDERADGRRAGALALLSRYTDPVSVEIITQLEALA